MLVGPLFFFFLFGPWSKGLSIGGGTGRHSEDTADKVESGATLSVLKPVGHNDLDVLGLFLRAGVR